MDDITIKIINPSRRYEVLNEVLERQRREAAGAPNNDPSNTSSNASAPPTTSTSTAAESRAPEARHNSRRTQQRNLADEDEHDVQSAIETSALRHNELALQRQNLFFERMEEFTNQLQEKRKVDFDEQREIRKRDRLEYEDRMFQRMERLIRPPPIQQETSAEDNQQNTENNNN